MAKTTRLYYLTLVILFFLGASCQPSKKIGSPNQIEKEIAHLNYLFAQGQYCNLLPIIKKQLAETSKNTTNWTQIKIMEGQSLMELEQWTEAKIWLEELKSKTANWDLLSKLQIDLIQARLLQKTEQHDLALLAYQALIQKLKDQPQLNHFLIETLAFYSFFQFKLGDYQLAEQLIEGFVHEEFPFSIETTKAISTLGILYTQQSKTLAADKCLLKAKTIYEKQGLNQHPAYALFLNHYALSFFYKGQLEKADSLLTIATKINQNACYIPSNIGFNFSAKAAVQKSLGKLKLAKKSINTCLVAFKDSRQNGEVALATFKLGEVYFAMDSIQQANNYYQQALVHLAQFIGKKEHLYHGLIYQAMGLLQKYKWQYAPADSLYELSRPIIGKILGKESIEYGTSLNNQATSKEEQKDYATALDLYLQVIHLDTTLQSKYHPYYLITLFNLARCYSKMKAFDQALHYYQKAINLQLRLLNDYYGNFSASTRLSYRLKAMGNFDVFNTYAVKHDQHALNYLIQKINLATKNRALDYSLQLQKSLLSEKDTSINKLHLQWITQKELLTKLYLKSESDRLTLGLSIDSIQQASDQLEKELSQYLFGQLSNYQEFKDQQIKQKLLPHEAAIDFFNFYVADEYGPFPDSILYYALLTRSDWDHPKLIPLIDEKGLKEILNLSTHYTLNAEVNHLLYQKIWQPLSDHLKGITDIHLSPDGLLHQVSFLSLNPNPDQDATLIDQYQFHYYSNLNNWLQKEEDPKKSPLNKLLLMGNIDYDTKNLSPISKTPTRITTFPSLPGTLIEMEQIQRQEPSNDYQFTIFQQEKASEQALRKQLRQTPPDILHLATHGFFLKKKKKQAIATSLSDRILTANNEFIRSGLVFSGVNLHWTSTSKIPTENDGVLTALEVANLDLSKTHLIVLSACNSGRGNLKNGEGIFGLERAFKMAGAQQILVSLWKVPDQQTAELMGYFYDFLLGGDVPQEALYLAQQKMAEEYANPYMWAGFVVFE